MSAVHVRIRHDNDFIIAKFADIKIIAVALGETTPKGIDHRFNFSVCQDFIDARLFHIENLSPDGKDCLKMPVASFFSGPSGRIPLHDKNFTDFWISAFTVGKFSVGIKGKLLFGEKICLCLFFCFSDFGGFFSAG